MVMRPRIVSREIVAQELSVSPALLVRYEEHGLIRATRDEGVEGYEPGELRRVWTVLSLHRDAGINLAGVECILRLRAQLDGLHLQMHWLVEELHALVEAEAEAPDDDEG